MLGNPVLQDDANLSVEVGGRLSTVLTALLFHCVCVRACILEYSDVRLNFFHLLGNIYEVLPNYSNNKKKKEVTIKKV